MLAQDTDTYDCDSLMQIDFAISDLLILICSNQTNPSRYSQPQRGQAKRVE